MDSSEPEIGQRFQQETKYYRPSYRSKPPEKVPEVSPSRTISLPPPTLDGGPSLWKTLRERRSVRDYSSLPLSLKDLSNLLWATQGITEKAFAPWYRTAPSAGALHPIDTYLVVNRVEGSRDAGNGCGLSLNTKAATFWCTGTGWRTAI